MIKTQRFTINMVAFTATLAAYGQNHSHPNVVVIITDEQRVDLCGREGYPLDVTPYVDKLAAENAWFNKAYTTSPTSVPARTSLFTGRYPKATHVRNNHNAFDVYFEKDLPTVFKEQGYKTALIGKNHTYLKPEDFNFWSSYLHWGKDIKDMPMSKEFSQFLNEEASGQYLKASPFGVEFQMPTQIVDQTLKWIDQVGSSPFFAYVSFPEPHSPYQVCEPYFSMFPPEKIPANRGTKDYLKKKGKKYEILNELQILSKTNVPENMGRVKSNYLGMIRLIDDQIKRLVEELKAKGLYENTVFVILSDHGDFFGEYGLMRKGAGVTDILTRVPMVWAGYGIKAEKQVMNAHVSIADIFPTLCSAIGAEIPNGIQGRSLWPMLRGEKYPEREFSSIMVEQGYGGADFTRNEPLTFEQEGCIDSRYEANMDELNSWTQSGTQRMLRKGDWKIIVDNYARGEMYNIKDDPSEINNLFYNKKFTSLKADLLLDLAGWEIRTQDPLPLPRRRYHFKKNPYNYLFTE